MRCEFWSLTLSGHLSVRLVHFMSCQVDTVYEYVCNFRPWQSSLNWACYVSIDLTSDAINFTWIKSYILSWRIVHLGLILETKKLHLDECPICIDIIYVNFRGIGHESYIQEISRIGHPYLTLEVKVKTSTF